jgi:hypothetical protein
MIVDADGDLIRRGCDGNLGQREHPSEAFNRDAAYVTTKTGKQQWYGFAGLDPQIDSEIYSHFVSWAIRQLTILSLHRTYMPTVSSRRD